VLTKLIEAKERFRRELEARIGEDGVRRAKEDGHARRRPRPCGLTIHTSLGCSFGCIYCYIYDMGFGRTTVDYPLSPEELAYAVLLNPYFVPGPYGTLIAVGSISEPFAPRVKSKSLEYIRILASMGNPVQVSTKAILNEEDVEFLRGSGSLDVLISVASLRMSKRLEPGAPHAFERLKSARTLLKHGLHPTLFLRPLIPGITDREVHEILSLARSEGFDSVVIGTLRVTEGIVARLNRAGIVLPYDRLPRLRGREQIPIKARDLKDYAGRIAHSLGVRVLPASCSSNIVAHGQACAICKMGPCGEVEKLPRVYESDVLEFLELKGVKAKVSVEELEVVIESPSRGLPDHIKYVVQTVSRRRVVIK